MDTLLLLCLGEMRQRFEEYLVTFDGNKENLERRKQRKTRTRQTPPDEKYMEAKKKLKVFRHRLISSVCMGLSPGLDFS